jgi:hypothetical protein
MQRSFLEGWKDEKDLVRKKPLDQNSATNSLNYCYVLSIGGIRGIGKGRMANIMRKWAVPLTGLAF